MHQSHSDHDQNMLEKVTIFSSMCFCALSGSTHDAKGVCFEHHALPRTMWVNSSAIMKESGGLLLQFQLGSYEIDSDKEKIDLLIFFSLLLDFTKSVAQKIRSMHEWKQPIQELVPGEFAGLSRSASLVFMIFFYFNLSSIVF